VASGTLYRHFPTRLDLIEAVLAEQIAELADLGRGLLTAEDEFNVLSTWLRAVLKHGPGQSNSSPPRPHPWYQSFFPKTSGAVIDLKVKGAVG
jgi:AcrR family transcriptional regulator